MSHDINYIYFEEKKTDRFDLNKRPVAKGSIVTHIRVGNYRHSTAQLRIAFIIRRYNRYIFIRVATSP